MGFFDRRPREEDDEPEDELECVEPAWMGPPRGEVPGVLTQSLILAHTEEVAVAIPSLFVYTTGFNLSLHVVARRTARSEDEFDPFGWAFNGLMGPRRGRTGDLPDQLLRFGVQFSDGRKATSVGEEEVWPEFDGEGDEEPEGPVLIHGGGGGGDEQFDVEMWVWPLPPAGTLDFVCEWPAKGIPETRTSIDASLVLDAAARARVLWLDVG